MFEELIDSMDLWITPQRVTSLEEVRHFLGDTNDLAWISPLATKRMSVESNLEELILLGYHN